MPTTNSLLQNRYKIIEELAAGGMGAVCLALDERLNALVAVKERRVEGDQIQRAFSREASLLANLRHPALPFVTDHFFENERQFLVMRYIPGDDLARTLEARSEPFQISTVLEWADQLLDALEYLHSHNPPVVHRDIKPANLKIDERGKIILLDFGLAKGARGQMSTLVAGHTIVGFTRNYAPLEQINGVETDPRSDVYSLGATLYHLMTRSVPVDASTRYCEIDEGKPDPLPEAHIVESLIPLDVSAVLKRAMTVSRSERIPTAVEMRQLLSKCSLVAQEQNDTRGRVPDPREIETLVVPTPLEAPVPIKQLKFEYWTKLNEILRSTNSIVRLKTIKPGFQVTGFIGHPQVQLFATVSAEHNRLIVGLRLLNRKDMYQALVRNRDTIENEIDGAHKDDFRWRERKRLQTISEITLTRQPENIHWRDRWPEYLKWHCDRLESFYRAFDPRVRKFKIRGASTPSTSDREKLVRSFWEGFDKRLTLESEQILLNSPYVTRGGGGKSWRNKSLAAGIKIAAQLNTSKNYVDVNLTAGTAQYDLFLQLNLDVEAIEDELGFSVEWKLNPKGESWVITRQAFSLNSSNTWDQTYDWLIQKIKSFLRVFSPRIQKFQTSSRDIDDRDFAVVKAYVCDGWSHRAIESKILGLPAPKRGGGFKAMSILQKYGITAVHKSCLSGQSLDRNAFEIAGDIQVYLQQKRG